jgi:hypothetical protein
MVLPWRRRSCTAKSRLCPAERLHTKQPAIARLEADFDGAMSLRRYVDFALACGFIPHHFTFTPIETARNFIITQQTGIQAT